MIEDEDGIVAFTARAVMGSHDFQNQRFPYVVGFNIRERHEDGTIRYYFAEKKSQVDETAHRLTLKGLDRRVKALVKNKEEAERIRRELDEAMKKLGEDLAATRAELFHEKKRRS